MPNYFEQYRSAISINAYFVQSAVDYWTAISYPAIYFARYL